MRYLVQPWGRGREIGEKVVLKQKARNLERERGILKSCAE